MTKMYIDRAIVEQALEALGSSQYPQPRQMAAITNLRTALDQQTEPVEPVGEVLHNWSTEKECIDGICAYLNDLGKNLPVGTKLYTAPPQQEPTKTTLSRGVNGVCSRSVCECEREKLGDQCIWLRPTDAELERRTGLRFTKAGLTLNHNDPASVQNQVNPMQEPVAWMYKAEPWFDGRVWHETYETTTDKTLAYFKDKNARALCFVEK